ncbi:MAG TPA: DUF892 family protein [Gaiellaceae bacterium]|nr:DUF892 family protein [Gaiellaceae bacterium]
MSDLFMRELEALLELEQRLQHEVLPDLRQRVRADGLRAALDRHQLQTKERVANLRRVRALAGRAELPSGDLEILAEILRVEHRMLASYELLVRAALALGVDGDAVRLLRLNMEQDAYALEEADHALGKLLAEKVENARARR